MDDLKGFLNLNKSAGFTSHDCVARVRKLLRTKRVGHAGTLDPAATGVLPIAIGKATRLLQYLQSDKAYRATIRFGMQTTTDDLEGEILHQEAVPWLELDAIKSVLPQFQGTIEQIPPSYSAIQVGGKRLYELARAGQAIEAPIRSVAVHHIEILEWRPGDFPELEVSIACGAGTYIRSIARDLGDVLNTRGTLAQLIRTDSSGFSLSHSLTLEDLAEQVEQRSIELIPPAIALSHLPIITLSDAQAKQWFQGQRIRSLDSEAIGIRRIHHENGDFLGIGELRLEEAIVLKPQVVFHPNPPFDLTKMDS